MPVARKTEVGPLDGTPQKRMFWSIISDYDLKTAVCELVDNAIDIWTLGGEKHPLAVHITLDAQSQFIAVRDNAGGVKREELRLLVAPGGSRNNPNDEIIGIFGVGGKRASIALGEHVEIKTRYKKQGTYQLDITKDWLETEDWEMPLYEVPDIAPATTTVEISRLRKPFGDLDIQDITTHLGSTYAWFLGKSCTLSINGNNVPRATFDKWAYPPGYEPRNAKFEMQFGDDKVRVEITAGLIADRDPETENYGVYAYCNNRLIVRDLKTRDVGYYVTAEAGVPHADASLCRAIIRINGPAKLMPWNSSKSGINPSHQVFQQLRPTLIQFVSYFSSLSRRLKRDWDEKVTPYRNGNMETVKTAEIAAGRRINLPELPRVNKPHVERLKERNKAVLKDQPWTVGLVEAIAAVDVITRQRLDTKNRIALILLDSNFEIAIKEFIVHRHDLFPPLVYNAAKIQTLFKQRSDVIQEVKAKVPKLANSLKKVNHYYGMRNKLIHERATVDITDTDVSNYRDTVEKILTTLFELKFPK